MYPSDYTNDPRVICQHDNLMAINSAIEIDLTGQAVADSIGQQLYSGMGGHADFMRGAALAQGGKPILALPSTAIRPDGPHSRIVPGEGTFRLSDAERENLRQYIQRGGFLLASAGCSSTEWDRSFRSEMAAVFADRPLQSIAQEHPLFHTVYDIEKLDARHGTPCPLQAVSIGGRLGVVYSQDGLNDTAHTSGCCCCGGNELANAVSINVNILAYALTY